ncbi:hypothetical protein RJ639_020312 [Escallonia herrerae]|uniref:Pentatricopeptide repeat-containing protein n=1 Tax=Escallonia herrerae TaxID=1293975 RepID=A0AA89AF46_9ASTE|nr:hypothetical protein RJ639_020312 [Escallonia herrerae]
MMRHYGCAHIRSFGLLLGKSAHGFATKNGWEIDVDLGTFLGNEVTFTGVLCACAQAEYGLKPGIQYNGCMVDSLGKAGYLGVAYEVFKTMPLEPNVVVLGSFLSSCKVYEQFEMGERVFERVLRTVRPDSDGGVGLYSDMRFWDEAERIRNLMVSQNVRKARRSRFIRSFNSWSLAIKNAASPSKALTIYSQMQRQSIPLDSYSILFTLKSCTHLKDITVIQHLHTHILKLGFNTHVYVGTSLLNGYVGTSFEAACHLFDEMPERNTVTWNTMITCLSRSGYVEKAWLLFEQMPERDLASWSAMITAYMNNGCWDKGLVLFREIMVSEKLKPDQVTLGSVLVGCGLVGLAGLMLSPCLFKLDQYDDVLYSRSARSLKTEFDMAKIIFKGMVRPENDGAAYTMMSDLYVIH